MCLGNKQHNLDPEYRLQTTKNSTSFHLSPIPVPIPRGKHETLKNDEPQRESIGHIIAGKSNGNRDKVIEANSIINLCCVQTVNMRFNARYLYDLFK